MKKLFRVLKGLARKNLLPVAPKDPPEKKPNSGWSNIDAANRERIAAKARREWESEGASASP